VSNQCEIHALRHRGRERSVGSTRPSTPPHDATPAVSTKLGAVPIVGSRHLDCPVLPGAMLEICGSAGEGRPARSFVRNSVSS
jgi:hypothetical protein